MCDVCFSSFLENTLLYLLIIKISAHWKIRLQHLVRAAAYVARASLSRLEICRCTGRGAYKKT